jgi:hypothetical protein
MLERAEHRALVAMMERETAGALRQAWRDFRVVYPGPEEEAVAVFKREFLEPGSVSDE